MLRNSWYCHLGRTHPLISPNQILKNAVVLLHPDRVAFLETQGKVITTYPKHSINITAICCGGQSLYVNKNKCDVNEKKNPTKEKNLIK